MSGFTGKFDHNPNVAVGATKQSGMVTIVSSIGSAVVVPAGARALVFLIDKSGSMDGRTGTKGDTKWHAARKAVAEGIKKIPDGTKFAVVLGGDSAQVFIPLQEANEVSRKKAVELMQSAPNGGGTNFGEWLKAVNAILEPLRGGMNVVIFLTDGENGSGDSQLATALKQASGLYQAECRGVGDGYQPQALREIVDACGGSVDGSQEAADLVASFTAIIEKTRSLAKSGVQLSFWCPKGATVTHVSQVSPSLIDLTPKLVPVPNAPRKQSVDTGSWGEETRIYQVIVSWEKDAIGLPDGPAKSCTRVSIVHTIGGAPQEVELGQDAILQAKWTTDEKASSLINPVVAHYTGQAELAAELQAGAQAIQKGDHEEATKRLLAARELAKNNPEKTEAINKMLVTDEKGTTRVRTNVTKGEAVNLDTQSTKTSRVK